ncbi:MAG: DUF2490 domain-containing protein [Candidatus Omnitrophica bacterium]|nr:DUF2490 domain-containing protein [Candidatus Omnitrophota bacterium]
MRIHKQIQKWIVGCIGLWSALFFLQLLHHPIAWARDDFQHWSKYEISKGLGSQFEIFYNPEFRLRDDASDFFYHEHRQGLKWKPSKFLNFSFNYLFARNQGKSGQPKWEHRGELDVTPNISLGRWNFSVRGRVELRQIQGSSGEEEWRFRIKPGISYHAELFGYHFKPYVENDLFYELERDAWNQNRVYIGASFPLGEAKGIRPSIGFYYMLQSQRSVREDWNSNHIFGTKFSVKL